MNLTQQLEMALNEAVGKSPAEGFAEDIGATKFKAEDGQFMAYVPKKMNDKDSAKILAYFDDMGFKNISVGNDSEALAKYMGLEKEYKSKSGMFVEADFPKGRIVRVKEGSLNSLGTLPKKKLSESTEDHIKKGYRTITGKVLSDKEVEAYNRLTDKINGYLKKGKPAPEELLNGRHNLFYQAGLKENLNEAFSKTELRIILDSLEFAQENDKNSKDTMRVDIISKIKKEL